MLRDCLVANGYSYNSGGLQVSDVDASGAGVLVDGCFFAGNRTPHGDGNNNIIGDNLEIRDTRVSTGGVSSTAIDLGGNDFEYAWSDCNEDNWHDEVQIIAGILEDCDASGVPDICEMETGVLADCDGNLIPDVCEGVNDLPGIIAMTGVGCDGGLLPRLCEISVIESRIANGIPRFNDRLLFPLAQLPPRGIGDVMVSVIASGDLDGATEFVVISVDDDPIGTAFTSGGYLCEQQIASFVIPAGEWDMSASSNGTLTMFASNTVAENECTESRFELKVSYIGVFTDCNANGIWDGCDVSSAASEDVDGDGTPDECQPDCDGDSIPDAWAIGQGLAPDCNMNGQPDSCDIIDGSSSDVDANGVPDECKPDCNQNGIPDSYEIATGMANDCNFNGRPDSCDIEELGEPDCDGDGVIDICAIAEGLVSDCNGNEIPDTCDLLNGASNDVDQNAIPDECQPDCDADGFPDAWAIATGVVADCNENATPDACDIAGGEADEDGDGTPDACELARGDLDLDGCVGAADLGLMLGLWGIPNPPIGDLDGDGFIGPADLGRLLGNWDC